MLSAGSGQPLKILLILEATLGGTARHVLDLADGLLARRHEVHLVYSSLRSDVQFRRGLEDLKVRFPWFRTCMIRMTREVRKSDFAAFLCMFQYVRRNGPFDVIHAHSTKAGLFGRLLLGAGNAAKIYTPHALMTMNPSLRGLRRWAVCRFESLMARLTRAVVVVSQDERRCAVQTGIEESKIVSIPNCVKRSPPELHVAMHQEKRRALGIPLGAVCVGFVGRFCEQKAPDRVLDVFASLKQRTSESVYLVMIGSGPLENSLKARAAALSLTQDVIWAGEQDGAAHMPAFDVLVNCSRYDGLSYSLLEALACGVPIVTTRVGGVEEIVESGRAGLVCNTWDVEEFSNLLALLVRNSSVRASLSKAALQASARFDFSVMIDAMCSLYAAARHVLPSPVPISSALPPEPYDLR
jgi:glycosyltransferase involved in cell wall biosynthesis